MTPTRRDFLAHSTLAGAFLALDPRLPLPRRERPSAGTRLLILGGTAFLGPQIVEAAKARGWTITLFNRGKTNPHLFPELEKLHGDRNGDLKSLEGREWDAVIDTSGYVPRHVRDSATLLRDAVKHYVFISTLSVYADNSKPGMDESSPVAELADETTEKVTGETYGALKALCEKAAQASIPDRTTVIRPGLIVGPGDSSDRFT
ncbi:MAG: NAD-dependent epimerase/dehydratase family protein, partial [Planctomycetota bacterium]